MGTRQSPTHHIGVIDVLFVYRVGCLSAMLNESGQTLHCIYNQCNDEVKVWTMPNAKNFKNCKICYGFLSSSKL